VVVLELIVGILNRQISYVAFSMTEFQEISQVRQVDHITDGVCRLTLASPRIASAAQPGQFVMVACGNGLDPLLRRPFSLHRITTDGAIQLLLKVVGHGTQWLAARKVGDCLDLLGPLGRGFTLTSDEPVALVGGGIGIAPLLFLADKLHERLRSGKKQPPLALLGARTGTELGSLVDAFATAGCHVLPATDDGSLGHHGVIGDLLSSHLPNVHQVFACGPHAMMATVARCCAGLHTPCQVSLEAHMACGLGACLGCTIHAADGTYRHVCTHGPVFQAKELAWL
jgi:dihydroorotate dehydrogenase electron transfer subunit